VIRHLKKRHGIIAVTALTLALCAAVATRANSASASGGASRYTFSDPSCTKKEDPRNLRFDNINGYEDYGSHGPLTPAATVNDIAGELWHGALFATDSYLYFYSDGGCLKETLQADDSLANGWHMRDWQGNSSTPPVYGAAHHDFHCGLGPAHSSDWWNWAAQKMANWFVAGFVDGKTGKRDFSASKVRERPVTARWQCGKQEWVIDNGNTIVVTQTVPLVTYNAP
jgi:hypothetical protein